MTAMPPPRQPEPEQLSPVLAAHALSVLNEYTHTIDALPVDLSRNFADLRELDAVLSSSMTSITAKITQLTDMLATRTTSAEDRLWLLADIADEVSRLKPGVNDKIHVACHAADALRGHKAHMSSLLNAIPDDEFSSTADRMGRRTKYPWVSDKLFGTANHGGENSRSRNRRGFMANGGVDSSSPNKRKRAAADVDGDVNKSPRKERTGDAARPRSGARKKDRGASPAESLVSVASQMPPPQANARQNNSNRAANGAPSSKRARAQATAVADDPATRADFLPPSATHPSLPPPFANNSRSASGTRNAVNEWPAGQLEGPGMPVARSFPGTPVQVPDTENESIAAPVDGDQEADDSTLYCFCHRGSFGEMIACDGAGCTVEWYHLECVGLKSPPSGSWICEDCRKKANGKRGGRGGKRRAGGGRSAARNTSA